MKSYKLFQICYTLNFIFCFLLFGLIVFRTLIQWDFDSFNVYMFITSTIITVIFAIFDWLCHDVLYAIKIGRPVSGTKKIAGRVFNIICIALTLFFISGLVSMIQSFIDSSQFKNIDQYLFLCLFSGLILTSVYLCISYWILLNQIKSDFSETIDEIGTGD